MSKKRGRIRRQTEAIRSRIRQEWMLNPRLQFPRNIVELIWQYKWFSLIIFAVTIFQEFAALWPVNLLGEFIDRLGTGDMGYTVWLFLAASLFYPGFVRANVILRHKMFYETDLSKRVELILKVSDAGEHTSPEAAGAAYTRTVNAVSGITNAVFLLLASFTPVIIKIIIVSGRLLGYNKLLGLSYLVSLIVPAAMTILFNKWLQVLRDSQYSLIGDVAGVAIETIGEKENLEARNKFLAIMRARTQVLISLLNRSQSFLYLREAILVCSQFLAIFLALSMQDSLDLTPGDFTRVIGYTTQVGAAFIGAASSIDNIISYSRAYHVYARAYRTRSGSKQGA